VPEALAPGPRRFHGFSLALEEAGLTVLPEHIIESDFTLEGGKRAARQLIQTDHLPTCVVVINDLMAIGLILELQAAGYRVPEDVAVLGYDNIPEASIVRPALTTIAQDPRDMGQKLATALFERIKNPDLPRRVYQSTFQLVIRDSA
jgi:DNA-binding LacI/PurR family transcriptional regulator